MTEALPDLSITEWAVLGVIAEHDTHGFSVARQFEPSGPLGRVWTVPRPLVYRAVDALVDGDLVQRAGSDPGARGPRRILLPAPAAGKAALENWLVQPLEPVRDARSHHLLKPLLIDRCDGDPTELVVAQRGSSVAMTSGLGLSSRPRPALTKFLLRWRLYSVQNLDRFLARVPGEPPRDAHGEDDATSQLTPRRADQASAEHEVLAPIARLPPPMPGLQRRWALSAEIQFLFTMALLWVGALGWGDVVLVETERF